jgi:hypothetical protein
MLTGIRMLAVLAVSTTLWVPLQAQGKGSNGSKEKAATVRTTVSVDVFDRGEITIIRDYYREPAGRPKPLPPGIAKNLARGKPLPPGIAKRSLPTDLASRLPVRDGVERVLAGDQVVMVRAGLVIDIVAIFQ